MLFSKEPLIGFLGLRKMWILLVLFFLPGTINKINKKKISFFVNFLSLSLLASSIYGIYQFIMTDNPILHRIKGFSDHQMTFAGTITLSLIFLLIYFIETHSKNVLIVTSVISGFVALIFSLSRSYWLAFFVSIILYFFIKKKFKFLLIFFLVILTTFLLSPVAVKYRMRHLFDYRESGNSARIEMWKAGGRIIKTHPFLGLGVNMIKSEGERYLKNPDFPATYFMHLHNDYLQIAAERGIPALIFYILFFFMLLYYFFIFFEKWKNSNIVVLSKSVFFVLIAFLIAGFFEYNFGDSEVFILLIFLISLPFTLARDGDLLDDET